MFITKILNLKYLGIGIISLAVTILILSKGKIPRALEILKMLFEGVKTTGKLFFTLLGFSNIKDFQSDFK